MTGSCTHVAFEALQARVNRLENLLCNLSRPAIEEDVLTSFELRKALQDAGIMDKDSVKP